MNSSNSSYARFIPREELEHVAAWRPDAFGDTATVPAAAATTESQREADRLAATQAARQAGYQEGYRDGLVALESFKESFARQTVAQIGALVAGFDAAFAGLEAQIAEAVARTATLLARQVVRSELATRPELVAQVASDAVQAVLLSARHMQVHVHPDDQALVRGGAGEVLSSRGAQLLSDASVPRGGCVVHADIGSIDARVDTRWAQAVAALGQSLALDDTGAGA